jgi:hypothetical protein
VNKAQQAGESERLAEELWREIAGASMHRWMRLTGDMSAGPEWLAFRTAVFELVASKIIKWLPPAPSDNGQAAAPPARRHRHGRV